MNLRIIPRLDIKGNNLVKGINLEGLRVLGKPSDFAQLYYEGGADELVYQDVVASLFRQNTLADLVSDLAKSVFIPLTVGGGISSLDDIHCLLRAGADKVSINTAALDRPVFLKEAVNKYGSSTIVSAIEVMKDKSGRYVCYSDNGRNPSGKDVCLWIDQVQSLGVGEIMLTSIAREGTGKGFDDELYQLIKSKVRVPLIIHGGAGCVSGVVRTSVQMGESLSGICIASLLHYDILQHHNLWRNVVDGNIDFIQSFNLPKYLQPTSIVKLKQDLYEAGIPCRYESGSVVNA